MFKNTAPSSPWVFGFLEHARGKVWVQTSFQYGYSSTIVDGLHITGIQIG